MEMRISLLAGMAGLLLLTGCATTGAFQATAALNEQGRALWEQGRYPEASAVFKRCIEVEQNPACVHNIGAMIENSQYIDPDPLARKSMRLERKGPAGVATQYYRLAARYGQQESIDALIRLGQEVPAADLAVQQPAAGAGGQSLSANEMEGLNSLARLAGCLLAGGNNCAGVAAPAQQQAMTQAPAPVNPASAQPIFNPKGGSQPVQQVVAGGCVMSTDCQYPASCVKAPGARTGTCAVEVDSAGLRTYDRSGQGVGCMYNSDCGVGFSCNRDRTTVREGICVKN